MLPGSSDRVPAGTRAPDFSRPGLLNCAHGLLNRAHGLIIRAHGLLSRAHGLARLNNYFPHGTAGAPYTTDDIKVESRFFVSTLP